MESFLSPALLQLNGYPGKTVTIVEAMKQVLKLSPGCKILAAAPSNAAADLLAERLKEHIPRKPQLFILFI